MILKIGYLDFLYLDGGIQKAGILVADKNTKPIEFRATTSLEIDELQRILYGDVLEETLIKENFALDLIKALKIKPDLVLVKDKELLEIRSKVNVPIGYISKFDPFKATYRYSKQISSKTGRFDTLVLMVNREYEKYLDEFVRKLQSVYKNFNLLEPFNRVYKALEYLSQEGG